MLQIQILLPLYDNEGKSFSSDFYTEIRTKLVEKFGGITAYTRSPAKGLWKENEEKVVQDDIVIYEVMAETLDPNFWKLYKERLMNMFAQEELIIRASEIIMI